MTEVTESRLICSNILTDSFAGPIMLHLIICVVGLARAPSNCFNISVALIITFVSIASLSFACWDRRYLNVEFVRSPTVQCHQLSQSRYSINVIVVYYLLHCVSLTCSALSCETHLTTIISELQRTFYTLNFLNNRLMLCFINSPKLNTQSSHVVSDTEVTIPSVTVESILTHKKTTVCNTQL